MMRLFKKHRNPVRKKIESTAEEEPKRVTATIDNSILDQSKPAIHIKLTKILEDISHKKVFMEIGPNPFNFSEEGIYVRKISDQSSGYGWTTQSVFKAIFYFNTNASSYYVARMVERFLFIKIPRKGGDKFEDYPIIKLSPVIHILVDGVSCYTLNITTEYEEMFYQK